MLAFSSRGCAAHPWARVGGDETSTAGSLPNERAQLRRGRACAHQQRHTPMSRHVGEVKGNRLVAAAQKDDAQALSADSPATGSPLGSIADRFFASQAAAAGPVSARMLTVLLQTPTVPIGSYVAAPTSFLHGLDARVKQLWLVVLMLLPGKCSLWGKLAFAGGLTAVTVAALPQRVWRPQLMQLAFLCGVLFIFTSIGADGVPPVTVLRMPPGAMEAVPLSMPPLDAAYSYVMAKLGPIMVTRRGAALAGGAALLTYSILLSAFLCLTTTPPEATVAALRWLLTPLRLFRVDVDEVALLVLLSLRFLSLVFEEIRNLALGVAVRGIDWQALGGLGQVATVASLCGQLFKNFFINANQIAGAMEVRGYRGTWQANAAMQYAAPFKLGWRDAVALIVLGGLVYSVQGILR